LDNIYTKTSSWYAKRDRTYYNLLDSHPSLVFKLYRLSIDSIYRYDPETPYQVALQQIRQNWFDPIGFTTHEYNPKTTDRNQILNILSEN